MTAAARNPHKKATWLVLFYVVTSATACPAQDDFFNSITVDIAADDAGDGSTSLLGWVTQKVGYGLEVPGPLFTRQDREINGIETSLYLQFDHELTSNTRLRISAKAYHDEVYRLQNGTAFTTAEIEEFRNRYEYRDVYLEHEFDNGTYVKAGHQIIAWGMSEYLRVTDLINIEDRYAFAQQDLENLRLQVPAVLASINAGDWLLDGVITRDAGFHQVSPAGDEFDPFAVARGAGFKIGMAGPEQQDEYFLRASRSYRQGDMQFVLGDFNDNNLTGRSLPAGLESSQQLLYGQQRMQAAGFAINRVSGPWLLFSDMALHRDRPVQPAPGHTPALLRGWDRKDQWLGAFGIEYSGFSNLLLTLEVDAIHTPEHDALMWGGRNQIGGGVRAYWTALNERLELLAVWNELPGGSARIGRVSLDYDWSDALSLGLLWVGYSAPEDSIFQAYGRNDVLQLQLQYNFQMP